MAFTAFSNAGEIVEAIRTVRQARKYSGDSVSPEHLETLLQVARWTGSARNTQPWHFVVIDDPDTLRQISELRPPINWVADAPLAIALVMDGKSPDSEIYDEGRVAERLLIAARVLGLGGGVAWYGDEAQTAAGKRILGVPDELFNRGVVVIGHATSTKDTRPNANIGGRKPMSEVASHNRYGQSLS
ncbi:MAG: nitroreductase family protein [Thermomicrobiales bacterium]|jgi:nitroreductase|nr:nitroreductase family protein [Thermomicrobiales bacterium]